MKNISNTNKYPVQIFLNKSNDVVVSFTGAFYKNFIIQDITFSVSKDTFYTMLNSLRLKKTATLKSNDMYIKIEIFPTETRIIAGDKDDKVVEVEKDSKFIEWLQSIDLRKSPRIKTLIPISVSSDGEFEYGAIIDISTSGFKIALNNPIKNVNQVSLSIFNSVSPIGDIYCEIKRTSSTNGKYIYGLEIKNISFDSEIALKELFLEESRKKQ